MCGNGQKINLRRYKKSYKIVLLFQLAGAGGTYLSEDKFANVRVLLMFRENLNIIIVGFWVHTGSFELLL